MTVRAKVQVQSITHHMWNAKAATVKLAPVYDTKNNKSWSEATPSGSIELTITNPAALAQFELGKFLFVDFSDAPEKEADEQ